jgi:transcriptional regulator with XRE-family HTH domain
VPYSASSSAVQALQSLGRRLREIRIDAGHTGRSLAAAAGWHESKVSRIEHGRVAPSPCDIHLWCASCDIPDLGNELVASLRAAEDMFTEWRRMERLGLRAAQDSVANLWENTTQFQIYSGWVIPSPIQTPGYIAAVLNSVRIRRKLADTDDDLHAAIKSRIDRQRLTTEGIHRFAILLEEHVLRNPVGGAETMTAQLGHLLVAGSLPSISLGIIPTGADRTQTRPVEGFWIFDNQRVAVELVSGYLTITQPHELALYRQAFTALAELAVFGQAARTLIREALTVIDR